MTLVKRIEQERGMKMSFDYSKLRGKIIEKYGTQYSFAKAMKWSERTLSLKMNGLRPWKQTDICKAMELLDIPESEMQDYFFKKKVQSI